MIVKGSMAEAVMVRDTVLVAVSKLWSGDGRGLLRLVELAKRGNAPGRR